MVGHAGQLDLAVQRLVAHAKQGAVGHPKTKAVGGNGGAFHVQRHGAALAEAPLRCVVGQQFPIAVVGAGHGAGAHQALELCPLAARDFGHSTFQRHLDFGQCRNRHPQRQLFVQHMVFTHIGVGQHVVAQLLRGAQPRAVAQHQPSMGAQHRDVVGDGLGVGRAHANVHHGDAAVVFAYQVVAGHLRQSGWWHALRIARFARRADTARDHIAGLHKSHIRAVRLGHLGMAQRNEFVDVKLVVGEQHKVLEMRRTGAAVVAQAVQRVVDSGRREQRQRRGMARR